MKQNTKITPPNEPNQGRQVTSEEVDAVMNSSKPVTERLDELHALRTELDLWASQMKDVERTPVLHYIDSAVSRLQQEGKPAV